MYCGAREHSRHKLATCEWLSAQDQTVTGADDLGQRHTSFLSEITCCAVHNTRQQIRFISLPEKFSSSSLYLPQAGAEAFKSFPKFISSFAIRPTAPERIFVRVLYEDL